MVRRGKLNCSNNQYDQRSKTNTSEPCKDQAPCIVVWLDCGQASNTACEDEKAKGERLLDSPETSAHQAPDWSRHKATDPERLLASDQQKGIALK